jgi:hypothetical protein
MSNDAFLLFLSLLQNLSSLHQQWHNHHKAEVSGHEHQGSVVIK